MFRCAARGLLLFFFTWSYATPQRIISLAPNLTEILFAMGAGSDVFGVSDYSDYPKAATKIPIVSNASQLNLEEILFLKPTLVLAMASDTENSELQQLQQFKISVHVFQINTIADIPATMINIGKLTGHASQAQQAAAKFNNELAQLKAQVKVNKPVKILYLLWQDPLLTIGHNTLIDQAITFCGGKNIFNDLNEADPTVSLASVVQRNPDIIIADYSNASWQTYWEKWPQISAVKNKQFYSINPDYLSRPGPRFILGLQQLCHIIRE